MEVSSGRRYVLRASTLLAGTLGLAALITLATIWASGSSHPGVGLAARTLVQAQSQAPFDSARLSGLSAPGRHRTVDLKNLPLSFEPNVGQASDRVSFVSHTGAMSLFLSPAETAITLQTKSSPAPSKGALAVGASSRRISPALPPRSRQVALRIKFIGANRSGRFEGADPLPGRSNYYLGKDPRRWHTNIPTYAEVKYRSVYPGIDLVYYGNRNEIEYDLIVAAGANPGAIKLGFEGADKIELDAQSNAVVNLAGERVLLRKPVIYQEVDGVKKRVDGAYVLFRRDHVAINGGLPRIGIKFASYDHRRPLVVDPALSYSTYLGGTAVQHCERGRH